VAPASMLGPSVWNRMKHFPEIPNIINGPPERNAYYLNEINSSMRVYLSEAFVETRPALKRSRRRMKVEKKLLARGKTCDRLRLVLGHLFFLSQGISRVSTCDRSMIWPGGFAQWASFF
jgi:hypothetical protein